VTRYVWECFQALPSTGIGQSECPSPGLQAREATSRGSPLGLAHLGSLVEMQLLAQLDLLVEACPMATCDELILGQ